MLYSKNLITYIRKIFLSFIILCSALSGYTQIVITGSNCVTGGAQTSFGVSGSWSSSTTMTWTCSGCSFVGLSTGTPLPSVTTVWSSSGTIYLNTSNPTSNSSFNVSLSSAFNPGSISNPTQSIPYNAIPGTINATAPTGGACGATTYTYYWMQSSDNTNFNDISGANSQNLSFSSGLTSTTYYKRRTVVNATSAVGYTGSATVTVAPQLVAGNVNPASQTINYGTNASTLTVTGVSGGNGTYTYQWISAPDAGFSSPVVISGATSNSYTPTGLMVTTYYRVVVSSYGDNKNSAAATVTVYPQLNPGNVNPVTQTINYNTVPTALTMSGASGGWGTYTYQWQSSPTSAFTAPTTISGATANNYAPPALTATTYYRVAVTSNGVTVYSAPITINVSPQLVAGTIAPATQTINYNTVPAILTLSGVSGGNGTYTYQWQSSPTSAFTTPTTISGATAVTYTPPALTSTTYYRVAVTSNGLTLYSAITTVTVYPQLVPGSVTPVSQTINYNTNASVLTLSGVSGGSGTYTYQWQSSTTSAFSSPVTISGATSITYTPTSLTAKTYYRVAVTSNGVTANSTIDSVLVYPQLNPGTVTPASQTINYNTNASVLTLSGVSGGSGTYTYQWQSSATSAFSSPVTISGATATTYTPTSLIVKTYYRVAVTSNGVTANSAIDSVLVYPQLNPGITSPITQTINYNTNASLLTLSGVSGGSGTYSYQWQSSPASSFASPTTVSGATATTYTPTSLTSTTYYRVAVTSNGLTAYSAIDTVKVNGALNGGTVSPASQTINYNTNASVLTLSGVSGGNGTYTYQWQSSSIPAFSSPVTISGATTTTYTPLSLTAKTYFRVAVTSNGITAYSVIDSVIVYPQLNPGIITPASQTINYNTNASVLTLSVVSGGSGTYTYQWQSSATSAFSSPVTISGATATTYTPTSLIAKTYYRVAVTSNGITANSAIDSVLVWPLLNPGITSPVTQTINYNTNASVLTLSGVTGGSGTYTYQWQSSPASTFASPVTVSGATATTYTPTSLTATTYYRVAVTSNGLTAYSAIDTVKVNGALNAGTTSPASQTINYNTNASVITLSGVSGGNGTFTYQWQSSTTSAFTSPVVISGATATTYTPTSLTAKTYFRVAVTSNGATAYSVIDSVMVYPQLNPGIITPSKQTINYNTNASLLTLSGVSGGNGTYTYQWQSSPATTFSSPVTIGGATATTYTPTSLTSTTYYRVAVTSNGVTAYSSLDTVNVNGSGSSTVSVFTTQTPAAGPGNDGSAITVGMKFRASVAGNVTGVKFYKNGIMTGAHTGLLYSNTGTVLASIAFTGETGSGWQSMNFTTPVSIAANTTYIIALFSADGNYEDDNSFFASSLTNGVLTALASGTDGPNGVYNYGASPTYPTATYLSPNYWVDVIFSTATATDTANAGTNHSITLPVSTDTLNGSASTSSSGNITNYTWTQISGPNTATIAKPNAAISAISGLIAGVYTFQLSIKDINNMVSTAQVTITVNPALPPPVANAGANQSITLPTSSVVLNGGGSTGNITSYNWTKISGPNTPVIVTPTTVATTVTGLIAGVYTFQLSLNGGASVSQTTVTVNAGVFVSVFTTQTPVAGPGNDGSAITVGMKFRASVSGVVTGVRFYKNPIMSGAHTGLLYSNTGGVLASIAFTGETGSGWQSMNFNTPVSIAANTTYIVALFSADGNYEDDNSFFASSLTHGVLTALAAGTDGPNGVYNYGASPTYPTATYLSPNYWVDVIFSSAAPAQDINYIRVRDITRPGIITSAAADALTDPNDVKQVTQYFDGIGRIVQTVSKQQTPLGNDFVLPQVYDALGREVVKYMPYASQTNDGNYKQNPLAEQGSFNTNQFPGEQYFYGQVNFEPSPLNRVSTILAPGTSWVGGNRGVNSQYQMNLSSDSVRYWTIAFVPGSIPTTTTTYAAGTLYKNITIDEAGHKVVEYKDLQGHIVLRKIQLSDVAGTAHVGWTSTYYIYDDLDNLRFVIQPKGVDLCLLNGTWNLTSIPNLTNELCFRYEFDFRKRVVIKKNPGAGELWMIYDNRDRLVMTQDSLLRSQQKWVFSKYDGLNRPDSTGTITDPSNYNNVGYHQNLASTSISYPNVSGYTNELLTQTFYDNYSWAPAHGLVNVLNTTYTSNASYFYTSYNVSPVYAQSINQFPSVRGMVTGSSVKVLNTANQFLGKVTFYDDHERIIQLQSINQTGGKDTITNQYDFCGKTVRNLLRHQKAGTNTQTHSVLSKMNYDANGRLLTMYKNIDNASSDQLISTNIYNELSQIQNKQLGNNLDNLAYAYNIKGWLSSINKQFVAGSAGNYFGMELGYDKLSSVAGTTSYNNPQYNGNIAGTIWKTAGDGVGRKYDFTYDNLNRLTGANFVQNTSGSVWDNGYIDFTTNNLTYDGNGNILTMNQKGFKVGGSAIIDQLTYSYQLNSNKLSQVNDLANDPTSKLGDFHFSGTKQSTDYTYDGNGNMLTDNNKAINPINYNFLNLPQLVTITAKGTVSYVYDGCGNKLYKTTVDNTVSPAKTTTTTFIDGFVYQACSPPAGGPVAADTLQFVVHEEGRARWAYHKYTTGYSAYGFEYDFFEKDHLGNTRVVLTQQKDTAKYLASMEGAFRNTETQLFNGISNTAYPRNTIPGYPADITITNPNDSVSRLNGNGPRTGPSLILKVMSGDKLDIGVQSFFNGTGSAPAPISSLNDVLNSLVSGIVQMTTGGKGSTAQLLDNAGPVYAGVNGFLPANESTPANKPKAYLNWILLDEQLKYVSSYPQSGAIQVGSAGVLNPLAITGIPITKNGYLYIWVSNETPNWDVFFDNLSVVHYTGPELEETHYYPYGLTMAAISTRAMKPKYAQNNFKYNGKELQNQEFSDGTGLEEYDYGARMQDPQLGVWHNIDPMTDKMRRWSPYNYAADNPVRFTDPDGMYILDGIGAVQGQSGKQEKTDDDLVNYVTTMDPNTGETNTTVSDAQYGDQTFSVTLSGASTPTTVSENGRAFIKAAEKQGAPGHPNESYDDGKGNITGGWGHVLNEEEKKLYTKGVIIPSKVQEAWFNKDIKNAETKVNSAITNPNINQNQYDALASLAFNTRGFSDSHLVDEVNAGNYFGASFEFGDWNAEKWAGIDKRRANEQALFRTPAGTNYTFNENLRTNMWRSTNPKSEFYTPNTPQFYRRIIHSLENETHFDKNDF